MTSDIRRRLGFAAAVALVVAACSGTAATSAPATPAAATPAACGAGGRVGRARGLGLDRLHRARPATIKIGIEGPFTGPNALTGEEMKNAIDDGVRGRSAGRSARTPSSPSTSTTSPIPPRAPPPTSRPRSARRSSPASSAGTARSRSPRWRSPRSTRSRTSSRWAPRASSTRSSTSDQAKYGYWTTKGWPDPAKLTIGYVQAIEDAIAAGTFTPAEKKVAIYGEDTDWGRSFGHGPQGPARRPSAGPSSARTTSRRRRPTSRPSSPATRTTTSR